MFSLHAAVVNDYLDQRLERVSRKLETARQRSERMRRIDLTPPAPVFSRSSFWNSHTQGFMYQTLCIRPNHLPLLLCASLLLIVAAEARVPRKPHVIGEKPKLMRNVPPHKRSSVESPTASPTPAPEHSRTNLPSDMVEFSKRIYSAMGRHNATLVVNEFKPQFDELNGKTDGELGKTLGAAFEVRLLELQQSVRHAKAMLQVINELSDAATGCILCDPKKTR